MVSATAAVLAGGRSTRMGRDKTLIPFGGRPLALRVADRMASVCDEVFVVAKGSLALSEVRVVCDGSDHHTPLAGIAAALATAAHEQVMVVACDLPFVSPDVVRGLLDMAGGWDAVVPVRSGRLEPLHAVWSRSALGVVEAALGDGERAPKRVLERLRVRRVDPAVWRMWDPHGTSFMNVNTVEELERARVLEAGR